MLFDLGEHALVLILWDRVARGLRHGPAPDNFPPPSGPYYRNLNIISINIEGPFKPWAIVSLLSSCIYPAEISLSWHGFDGPTPLCPSLHPLRCGSVVALGGLRLLLRLIEIFRQDLVQHI